KEKVFKPMDTNEKESSQCKRVGERIERTQLVEAKKYKVLSSIQRLRRKKTAKQQCWKTKSARKWRKKEVGGKQAKESQPAFCRSSKTVHKWIPNFKGENANKYYWRRKSGGAVDARVMKREGKKSSDEETTKGD
ncbi:MAG: hypothetical protein Q8754_02915, partial [Sweet potato little leaf phytoplasma]|nr:hypothetical protein [Sweet potato little leaf phytoplasma]